MRPSILSSDGRLSEAGGILWNDGTGVNFGRGDDPALWQYEYLREIDYGSAAALMVRAALWQEIGGYDERYVPMYYEDADLCLQARQRGWHVLYEPGSVVVHVEGGTAGTDPQAGHKRHQEANRVTFVKKWQSILDADHLPPGDRRIREAASRHRGPRVLVVDFRMPMWDRDAGSLRMLEILRSLLRQGYGVTFVPDNFAPFEPYTRKLQELGVEVIYGGSTSCQSSPTLGRVSLLRSSRVPIQRAGGWTPYESSRPGYRDLRYGRPALGTRVASLCAQQT